MVKPRRNTARLLTAAVLACVVVVVALGFAVVCSSNGRPVPPPKDRPRLAYRPRQPVLDTSGFMLVNAQVPPWRARASLEEVRDAWDHVGYRTLDLMDQQLAASGLTQTPPLPALLARASLLNY